MPASEAQDQPMADAAAETTPEEIGIETRPARIALLPGAHDKGASFQFDHEDHTLGNALRYIIMKNPDVEYCGYSIPHPSEAKLNIRIQTYEGAPIDALRKGLKDLEDLCDVVTDKFTAERDAFDRNS